MKKVFTFVLTMILLFANCGSTYALESGVSSFSIEPIAADQKDKFIYVNITAPKTQADSKLLVGFFTDGSLTRLTPLDISTATTFTSQKINTYVTIKDPAGNYFLDQTPDEIRIFTWNQNTLAPQTLCDNVLNPEIIKAANVEVVESLKIVPEATQYIRSNHLTWEEDYLDGIADSWDTHLFPIMDYIDACAAGAIEDAETHLLTSLYAQEQYSDELAQIRKLINEAPSEQKSKMTDLLDAAALGKEYYAALSNAMKFLDFSLTET